MTRSELHEVRVEAAESRMFTRLFIDGKELRGITRVWFDTGRINDSGPRLSFMDRTTIHVEFVPERLLVEANNAHVDAHEIAPADVSR